MTNRVTPLYRIEQNSTSSRIPAQTDGPIENWSLVKGKELSAVVWVLLVQKGTIGSFLMMHNPKHSTRLPIPPPSLWYNMAEFVALRAAFVRLGFTAPAAIALVDEQGLDSLDEIRRLDDSGVSELCKTIRCPGGIIVVADAQAANPGMAGDAARAAV
jgi:hypothetical protein